MPRNKDAITRCLAIDKCLHNHARHFCLEDLRKACNRALYLTDDDGVSIRTIQNDLIYMRSENGYNAEIEEYWIDRRKYFRYADKHFTITNQPMNAEEASILQQVMLLLSRFDGNPALDWIEDLKLKLEEVTQIGNQKQIMSFENNPYLKNIELLRSLFNVIIEQKVINLTYHPFGKEEVKYIVHPYLLKQYNKRWYLLGKISTSELYTFPIDRIKSIKELIGEDYQTMDFDAEDYFSDIIGVTKYVDRKVERIMVAISLERFPFIETNPLHPSQRIIKRGMSEKYQDWTNTHKIIALDVIINHELFNTILSFGKDMIVLEPLILKEIILQNLKENMAHYQ